MSNDNHLGAPLVSRRSLLVGSVGVGCASAGYLVHRSMDRARSDEFMYSRIKDLVPEHVAWTIRYHSGRVDALRPYCNAQDLAHLDGCLARFQPFDMCRKSYRHLPRVDMAKYRALIEDMFPQPILF
jgi:hypothetical protein